MSLSVNTLCGVAIVGLFSAFSCLCAFRVFSVYHSHCVYFIRCPDQFAFEFGRLISGWPGIDDSVFTCYLIAFGPLLISAVFWLDSLSLRVFVRSV